MVTEHKVSKSDYKDAYYVLTADIALNDTAAFDRWETTAPAYTWMSIGFITVSFDGVFDRNGYTVSGLYIASHNECTSRSLYFLQLADRRFIVTGFLFIAIGFLNHPYNGGRTTKMQGGLAALHFCI